MHFSIFRMANHPSTIRNPRTKPVRKGLQLCTALFPIQIYYPVFGSRKKVLLPFSSHAPRKHSDIRPTLPDYDMLQTSVRARNSSRRTIFCEFSSTRALSRFMPPTYRHSESFIHQNTYSVYKRTLRPALSRALRWIQV